MSQCTKCHGLGYYDDGHQNDDGSMSGGNFVECEACHVKQVCTSDEWLANATQSTRDLANKIKGQQLRGTGNQFRNEDEAEIRAREINELKTEINRLEGELKKANAQTEEFERKWYLCCDIIETLKGEQVVMVNLMRESLHVIETIETDDPDEFDELTRLKGHMGKLIEQSLTSLMGKK